MRLLTDENVAASVVRALRAAGHDVFDVKEAGWQGQSDEALVRTALRGRRIIITHDKDFLNEILVPVIILHFHRKEPAVVADALCTFLRSSMARKVRRSVRVLLAEQRVEFHRR